MKEESQINNQELIDINQNQIGIQSN